MVQLQSTRDYEASSLRKALQIMDVFTPNSPVLSLGEISNKTGLNKSTVHRLLQTLCSGGWIVQDQETGKYTVGIRVFQIGAVAVESLGLGVHSTEHLKALSEIVGETSHMAVLDQGEIVYVNKVEGPQSIRMVSRVGARAPLHCTAMGKILLAYMPREEALRWIEEKKLTRYTPITITSKEQLLAQLDVIRNEGYAIHDGEYEEGVCCVGAPIYNYTGKVIAAMSVSGPSFRMRARGLDFYIKEVTRFAKIISRDLGYSPEEKTVSGSEV
ncbi:MAG: IclR family transcriptional regulator [Bacillota bacterium]|nr:IclR family transcriptional regulator [Bacillota bacterium]